MHDELNKISKKPTYKELNYDKLSMEEQSSKWDEYNLERDNSVMTDFFGGQLMNRLQCLSCGH
jgi:ubiquitin C-terminal hydrolase